MKIHRYDPNGSRAEDRGASLGDIADFIYGLKATKFLKSPLKKVIYLFIASILFLLRRGKTINIRGIIEIAPVAYRYTGRRLDPDEDVLPNETVIVPEVRVGPLLIYLLNMGGYVPLCIQDEVIHIMSCEEEHVTKLFDMVGALETGHAGEGLRGNISRKAQLDVDKQVGYSTEGIDNWVNIGRRWDQEWLKS